jgi:DNA-directed RNA polymerase specialized sigma24 family protein
VTEVDRAWVGSRRGDREAFARWLDLIEIPLRRSLRRYARAVDGEVVVQETFLRMWIRAVDDDRPLEGENASLRFALRVAANVAREEIRAARLDHLVPLEGMDDPPDPRAEPAPDPGLRGVLGRCVERLPDRPRDALLARLRGRGEPDRDLAARVRMTTNTFLQNIVRARKLLARCLEEGGVRLAEVLR